jgi:hypothetical protein
MTDRTFGAQYLSCGSAGERVALEREHSRRRPFDAVDAAVHELFARALRGERVARVERKGALRDGTVRLDIGEDTRSVLHAHFGRAEQGARGAWYLPTKRTVIACGHVSFVHWWQVDRRYANSNAQQDRVAAEIDGDAAVVWAALHPVFRDLLLPVSLLALNGRNLKAAKKSELWESVINPLYDATGVDPQLLNALRPGREWSPRRTDDIVERRARLIEALVGSAATAGERIRAHCIGWLVERYYDRPAGRPAVFQKVVAPDLQPAFSTYFGGDWLAFLDFLGEAPAADAEVTTALPKPRLMVGASARRTAVAAQFGLPEDEIARMLASFGTANTQTSPIEDRIGVLRRFWDAFDTYETLSNHSPYWLTTAKMHATRPMVDPRGVPYHERPFSPELLAELKLHWGTKAFWRKEDKTVAVVSRADHVHAASTAFGPAATVWHELSSRFWTWCAGSATVTVATAEEWARRTLPLDELERMGLPIGPFFASLSEVNEERKRRFPPTSRGPGIPGGPAYLLVQDVITQHRREWAERHLADYLRRRWEQDLLNVADQHSRHTASAGKEPTVRKFFDFAAPAADNWFGGDIYAVYGALMLKAPTPPQTHRPIRVGDERAFINQVFENLGPSHAPEVHRSDSETQESWKLKLKPRQRDGVLERIAGRALVWVQLAEGLGRAPTAKEFGNQEVQYYADVEGWDLDTAWRTYCRSVESAIAAVGVSD